MASLQLIKVFVLEFKFLQWHSYAKYIWGKKKREFTLINT